MPSLFESFRFTVSDGVTDTTVTPLISGLKRSWQREGDTRSYRVKLNTKLLFRKDDYVLFRALYDTGDCTEVTLLIENYCGGEWVTWHEGLIPIFQGDYNASRCTVEFDILPNDVYECANKGFNLGANWLDYATPVTVKTLYGEIETISCHIITNAGLPVNTFKFYKGCWDTGYTDSPDPDPTTAWRPISHSQGFDFITITGLWRFTVTTTWARETIDSVGMPVGGGWINTTGTTWVRPIPVSFVNKTSGSQQYHFAWEARLINSQPVSNGRALGDVLTEAVAALDCDFDSVVSNFFGINPDATEPSNVPYTYAAANFQNVFFYQKSDIVRATASNDATRFTISIKEFFEELKILNVSWAITNVGGVKTLRIEHYTYFEGANGLDLTTADGGKYIVGLDSFKAETAVPNFESFAYQESYREKFLVKRITYPADCATTQGDERTANQMNADFGGLVENPDAGLEGFFLMATEDIGGGEFLMNTLGGEANGAFAWENLLPALWADGRFHMDATANVPGYAVTSVAKNRLSPRITAKYCCDDEFVASELVKNQLGWGEVKTAEQDTERGTIALTLLH